MKKRFLTAVAGTILAAGLLVGCGAADQAADKAANGAASVAEAAGSVADQAAAVDFKADPIDLKIGVVGAIYDDLWKPAVDQLAKQGINLEITQFSDYVTPNNALANGEVDLNAFQHQIYLQSEIDQYNYELTNIGNTFIIPLNVYSTKISSLDELKDGDTIAVPNDPTNEGRALKVLAAAGVIKLKDNDNFNPNLEDIESYTKDVKIEELAANTIPSTLPDVTAAVVNGNYALDFGLKTEEAIYKDSVLDQEEYWNLIAARTKDLSDPRLVAAYDAVVKAFQSDATNEIFKKDYDGYFIAEGWDQDRLADYK